MNSAQRQSYVGVLKFKTVDELKERLVEVLDAIENRRKGSTPVGNWYFEREALKRELESRGI